MFTGIVQSTGCITALEQGGGDLRLWVTLNQSWFDRIKPGDSIAVSGVCLTVIDIAQREDAGPGTASFAADVSNETLSMTTLGQLVIGSRVNLEPALRAGDALGGHLLSGHVDGIGEVREIVADARCIRIRFSYPRSLAQFLARKGSIAVDGVSLTINTVDDQDFSVNVIPHTQAVTTLGEYRVGRSVNLEIDLLARYVERLLTVAGSAIVQTGATR